MSDANLALARRFFDEMCNGRQLDIADQLFSPGHVYHDPASSWVGPGPSGMKDLIGAYQRSFGDAHWTVHAMLVADDTVVTRWTGSGTHTADLMGIAATNKKVAVDGIWMQRVASGKIAESWNCWDMLGLLQQLGVAPAVGAKT